MANNLGLDPFPDRIGHFGGPWRPFWILQAVRRCRRRASVPFTAWLVLILFFPLGLVDHVLEQPPGQLGCVWEQEGGLTFLNWSTLVPTSAHLE